MASGSAWASTILSPASVYGSASSKVKQLPALSPSINRRLCWQSIDVSNEQAWVQVSRAGDTMPGAHHGGTGVPEHLANHEIAISDTSMCQRNAGLEGLSTCLPDRFAARLQASASFSYLATSLTWTAAPSSCSEAQSSVS
jgi:hypothetical protein